MDFEELLGRFRALGGVAENFRLGHGPNGRGGFVIDRSKPVTILAPENLTYPLDSLELRDGRLRVKTDANVGQAERAFFDDYQREFGWNGGIRDELWHRQVEWSRLPGRVVGFMQSMGTLVDPYLPFQPPDDDVCFNQFVFSRDFLYRKQRRIVPLLDIPNHHGLAAGFDIRDEGVAIRGSFDDEIFVRYNVADAWSNAVSYNFAGVSAFAYSVGMVVDLHDGIRLNVKRFHNEAQAVSDARFPVVERDGNTVTLSHLSLGNLSMPDRPRGIFRAILAPRVDAVHADLAFDGIAHFNRKKFIDALRLLDGVEGNVARMLRSAALFQLEALSSSIGAAAL